MANSYQPDPIFTDGAAQAQLHPVSNFERWYRAANAVIGFPAQTMALATVSATAQPDVRIVLLQAIVDHSLVFFTNLNSAKGRDLKANSKAAACFHWPALGQQVRLRGEVQSVDEAYADQYFAGRPRAAQLGAHASPQSAVIGRRSDLLDRLHAADAQFAQAQVPRPAHWSGLRLIPTEIEFWQDCSDRLHDRLLYTQNPDTMEWTINRLAP